MTYPCPNCGEMTDKTFHCANDNKKLKALKKKLPKRGNAWLVRDKEGKMRRALFFHPSHARKYSNYELLNLRTEVVEVKVFIFTI